MEINAKKRPYVKKKALLPEGSGEPAAEPKEDIDHKHITTTTLWLSIKT